MKHPINVEKYSGTPRELVEDICNLRYDSLEDFFKYAAEKFEKDSKNDLMLGHPKVSEKLRLLSIKMDESKEIVKSLWEICEKYIGKE